MQEDQPVFLMRAFLTVLQKLYSIAYVSGGASQQQISRWVGIHSQESCSSDFEPSVDPELKLLEEDNDAQYIYRAKYKHNRRTMFL